MNHTPGTWMHLSGGHVTTTAGPDWPSHVVADCDKEDDAHYIAHVQRTYPDLLAALADVELRCTQARIASTIGKGKDRTDFLRGELERIAKCARAAIARIEGAK